MQSINHFFIHLSTSYFVNYFLPESNNTFCRRLTVLDFCLAISSNIISLMYAPLQTSIQLQAVICSSFLKGVQCSSVHWFRCYSGQIFTWLRNWTGPKIAQHSFQKYTRVNQLHCKNSQRIRLAYMWTKP